jgi:hypothetical protein
VIIGLLSQELIIKLTYWTPLIAFVLSSLGLIALRWIPGLPPWAQRLSASPFYFVSLPFATLVVGLEMFVWMVAYVFELKELYAVDRSLEIILLIWRGFGCFLQVFPVAISLFISSFLVFCVLPFVSARMLWRALRQQGERKYSSNGARHFGVLLLLFVFAWTFLVMTTSILLAEEIWFITFADSLPYKEFCNAAADGHR